MEKFKDQVALITGGSGGIGEATAIKFIEEGAKVGILGRDGKKLAEVAERIRSKGGEVIELIADVTNREELDRAIKRLREVFGERIDVLVNGAGIYQRSPLSKVTEEDWDETMDINAKGTFLCSQIIAELMKEQGGGKIVNISSLTAEIGGSAPHYAASKAAIIGLTRSLAQTLGPYGINVNVVLPGPTDTDMISVIPQDRLESLKQSIPLKRIGKPDEIAAVIVFLASSDADYITGASLNVNGGLYMG